MLKVQLSAGISTVCAISFTLNGESSNWQLKSITSTLTVRTKASSCLKLKLPRRYEVPRKKELRGIFPNMNENKENIENHEELQYLNLIRSILDFGDKRLDRTGVGTISLFGAQCRYSLRDNNFPLLTTKQVFIRGIAEELFWFIRGSTNAKDLSAKNVKIWEANGSREFLDSIGLSHREEGDLGPVYGFQWRHFGAEYENMHADYSNKGIDQLSTVIKQIQTDRYSRRIILCAWNPSDLSKMALPPCHCFVQFYVNSKDELSCLLYQRSGDMGLGVPFNIASYALLTIMLAHVCKLKPGEFVHTLGDAHVYLNHIDALKVQLEREPRPFPKMFIKRNVENIEDFKYDDFQLTDYHPYPRIKMEMAL